MSLFIRSMIGDSWQLAEETKESLLFNRNDGESSVAHYAIEDGRAMLTLSEGSATT